MDGLILADGLTLGLTLGLTEGDTDALGLTEGDTDGLALTVEALKTNMPTIDSIPAATSVNSGEPVEVFAVATI